MPTAKEVEAVRERIEAVMGSRFGREMDGSTFILDLEPWRGIGDGWDELDGDRRWEVLTNEVTWQGFDESEKNDVVRRIADGDQPDIWFDGVDQGGPDADQAERAALLRETHDRFIRTRAEDYVSEYANGSDAPEVSKEAWIAEFSRGSKEAWEQVLVEMAPLSNKEIAEGLETAKRSEETSRRAKVSMAELELGIARDNVELAQLEAETLQRELHSMRDEGASIRLSEKGVDYGDRLHGSDPIPVAPDMEAVLDEIERSWPANDNWSPDDLGLEAPDSPTDAELDRMFAEKEAEWTAMLGDDATMGDGAAPTEIARHGENPGRAVFLPTWDVTQGNTENPGPEKPRSDFERMLDGAGESAKYQTRDIDKGHDR